MNKCARCGIPTCGYLCPECEAKEEAELEARRREDKLDEWFSQLSIYKKEFIKSNFK